MKLVWRTISTINPQKISLIRRYTEPKPSQYSNSYEQFNEINCTSQKYVSHYFRDAEFCRFISYLMCRSISYIWRRNISEVFVATTTLPRGHLVIIPNEVAAYGVESLHVAIFQNVPRL